MQPNQPTTETVVDGKRMIQNPLEWIIENGAKTETGLAMDLRTHLYMNDFLTDESQYICCMKASQVGFTTSAIFKTFYDAMDKNMDIIYTMPSASDSDTLVGGKVNRILTNNDPMFAGAIKAKDSVRQKQLGQSMIYFRGTKNEQQAISVAADEVVVDELDRSDQRIVEMMSSRLQHSKWRRLRVFSNPSYENNGVHKFWNLSDQKHWFITCPHCSYEQYLSFPQSIDMVSETYVCKKCHGELSSENRRVGRWRKKFPGRAWSGYWISALMAPWLDAKYIINEYRTKSQEFFNNFVIGIPYVGGDAKLAYADFTKNITPETNKQEGRIVIGIDPGFPIWYTIGNQDGIFNHGKTTDWEHIRYLMTRRFPEAIAIIDIGGGGIEPRKLLEEFPGRVFLCQFGNSTRTLQLVTWGAENNYGMVYVDRNRMIQLMLDEYRDSRVPMSGKVEDYSEMWIHFNNVTRKTIVDKVSKMEKYVYEGLKPDHLLFSTLYWRVGMDMFGFGGGEILSKDDDDIRAEMGSVIHVGDQLDDMEF